MKNILQQPNKEFLKRLDWVRKEEEKLYKRAKIRRMLVISFPMKKRVPIIVKIATAIINGNGGIIDTNYFDLKNKN